MFGLGIWEVMVILAVALIVLGPRRLPGMARQLGNALREFRRATNELRYSLDEATTDKVDTRPPVPDREPTEIVSGRPEVRDERPPPASTADTPVAAAEQSSQVRENDD